MRKIATVFMTATALAALAIAPTFAATSATTAAPVVSKQNATPTPAPMASPAVIKTVKPVHMAMAVPHYRPRLSNVLAELGKLNHRIAIDGKRGTLTRAEQASLKRSEQQLRRNAIHTASRQNGVLNSGQYVAFNHQIRVLGKKLHDLADKA